jgi:hypothetical protein
MSPAEGQIGTDHDGRAIFPDYETGEAALRAQIREALRLSNARLTEKIYKVSDDNNWGSPQPIFTDLDNQDLSYPYWSGTYSTGSLNGDGGGNLTEVSTEEGQRRVIEAIKRFTGYSEPDAVGSMTEKVCPENDSAGEGDSMSESYEEGGGSY